MNQGKVYLRERLQSVQSTEERNSILNEIRLSTSFLMDEYFESDRIDDLRMAMNYGRLQIGNMSDEDCWDCHKEIANHFNYKSTSLIDYELEYKIQMNVYSAFVNNYHRKRYEEY